MSINVVLLNGAQLPTKQTEGSAGFDLYSFGEYIVEPNERRIVQTGVLIELPQGYFGEVKPRSGLTSTGIDILFCPIIETNEKESDQMNYEENGSKNILFSKPPYDVKYGVIDSDYRGQIGVIVHNTTNLPYTIANRTRIAQLIIQKHYEGKFNVVSSLGNTKRGESGFGSTGLF